MNFRADLLPPPALLGRRGFLATGAGALTAAAFPSGDGRAAPPGKSVARPIIVASKIDTEGALLGNIIAQALLAAGIPVETRLQLGPTRIVRQALISGAIDLYPEYTGNGASFFHRAGAAEWHDAKTAFETVKALDAQAHDLVWLPPAQADNGWGIAVPRALAREAGLATLADFGRHAGAGRPILLATSVEFVESADALPAFEHAYGFRLRQEQLLMLAGGDTSATIRAASEGISGVNAAMAYGTDGALEALGLVLLADPKRAQIVFQPAPVVRRDALEGHPGIEAALAPAFAGLSIEVLRHLNARIAAVGDAPADVARAYLAGLARHA